jgi:hypothetical protein
MTAYSDMLEMFCYDFDGSPEEYIRGLDEIRWKVKIWLEELSGVVEWIDEEIGSEDEEEDENEYFSDESEGTDHY